MRSAPFALLLLVACAARDEAPPFVVEVGRDARIRVAGCAISIAALEEVLADVDPARRIVIRADARAPWMHVQWAMAAVGSAGFERVDLAERGSAGPAASGVPLHVGEWHHGAWHSSQEGLWCRVGVHAAPDFEYDVQLDWEWDPAASRRELRAHVARFARMRPWTDDARTFYVVAPDPDAAFRSVLRALRIGPFARPDVTFLAVLRIPPEDRERVLLPAPVGNDPVFQFGSFSLGQEQSVPIEPPVARSAVEDRDDDPDDRLVVTLTDDGRLWFRRELSLDELAAALGKAKEIHEKKMRRMDRTAVVPDDEGHAWSRLFVLLRVDRRAPWRSVAWVLAELRSADLFRIQFVATERPGTPVPSREQRRRWERGPVQPLSTLEGKLPLSRSHQPPGHDAVPLLVRVEADGRIDLQGRSAPTLADLDAWAAAERLERPDAPLWAEIEADPNASLGAVIAAVDRLRRAGIERVEFADLERAPEDVRRRKPLPVERE